ncbi:MAG: NAD-dependent epimerase/dehydratase family protein [bacterium]
MKGKKEKTPKEIPYSERVIAIIGTNGFKGSHIIQELENDRRVKYYVIIDRKKPPIVTRKAKFYKFDLTETLADVRLSEILKKEKVHTFIDTAIPTTPPRNQSLSHEIISVGSMYICNAIADAGVKKLVLSSTTDVYGAFPDNPNFLTEEYPTRGGLKNRFLADKIDAERSALKLHRKRPEITVSIIRTCHILGPTIQSYKTRYLSRPVILTMMGYDPLMQFVHESDVIRAFMLAIEKDCPGVFNIVGQGVLPLSRVIRILGKVEVPMPEIALKNLVQLLWYSDMSPAPASYLNFLKYMCIADGEKAKKLMGFSPKYSTRETLLSFVGAERLREVDLIEAEHEAV